MRKNIFSVCSFCVIVIFATQLYPPLQYEIKFHQISVASCFPTPLLSSSASRNVMGETKRHIKGISFVTSNVSEDFEYRVWFFRETQNECSFYKAGRNIRCHHLSREYQPYFSTVRFVAFIMAGVFVASATFGEIFFSIFGKVWNNTEY